MDFIEALSAAYLTTCLVHDEDLEQLCWYVKQVQEVLYIYINICMYVPVCPTTWNKQERYQLLPASAMSLHLS